MSPPPRRPRRRALRHAQIHLPPMTGEQAFFLVDALEHAIRAICRAHGDDIADFQGRVFPELPPPPDAQTVTRLAPADSDDDHFPF